MLPKIQILTIALMMTGLVGCTATAKTDGSCKRQKAPCPIGGGNMKGHALTGAVKIKSCTVGATLSNQKYQFLVYEDTSSAKKSEETAESKESTDNFSAVPSRIPKAGISFTPVVSGGLTLVTPQEEWCTDSCGIATVEFTPICGEQESSAGILVPGMLFEGEEDIIPSTSFIIDFE